jgi:hypothetical protein
MPLNDAYFGGCFFMNIKSYWDHSGKPSVFVVVKDGVEVYRGTFVEGYALYQSLQKK